MDVVVQKYGGSSVADLPRLRRVAARIAATVEQGTRVVAVVSAMGNTTNELLALARQVTPEPDRRELDMLVSVGERISVALVAMALRDLGVPAVSLTGSQSGIITDESHADARVVEVRPARLRAALERGEVAVVAGFQGVSRAREVTTLGRGGSDTTAVVLAAALGARHCEICSDVDGVWSADPRVVTDARQLPTLGLDEALALARGGAKVLFEDAVRYARDHGVQIVASATEGPGAGTRIVAERPARERAVAVTSDDQVVRMDAVSPELAAALRAAGARVRARADGRVWADVRNAHGALPAAAVRTALVTAVGSDLSQRLDLALAAEAALAGAGVAVQAASGGGDALWWEVAPEAAARACAVLHEVLVTGAPG